MRKSKLKDLDTAINLYFYYNLDFPRSLSTQAQQDKLKAWQPICLHSVTQCHIHFMDITSFHLYNVISFCPYINPIVVVAINSVLVTCGQLQQTLQACACCSMLNISSKLNSWHCYLQGIHCLTFTLSHLSPEEQPFKISYISPSIILCVPDFLQCPNTPASIGEPLAAIASEICSCSGYPISLFNLGASLKCFLLWSFWFDLI